MGCPRRSVAPGQILCIAAIFSKSSLTTHFFSTLPHTHTLCFPHTRNDRGSIDWSAPVGRNQIASPAVKDMLVRRFPTGPRPLKYKVLPILTFIDRIMDLPFLMTTPMGGAEVSVTTQHHLPHKKSLPSAGIWCGVFNSKSLPIGRVNDDHDDCLNCHLYFVAQVRLLVQATESTAYWT